MSGLLVVAGEASADLHGSRVLRELRRLRPELRVGGIGSDLCRAEGMEILVDSRELSIMGLTEALSLVSRARRAFDRCLAWSAEAGVDAALLIDFADFNLRLAARLKERGIKVVYFISPKVWAWRIGRVTQLRQRVDRMLVIFPFEVEFLRRHGVRAEYVGNPSVDELHPAPARADARRALGVGENTPLVALMPGSRRTEVARHLSMVLDAARIVSREQPAMRFVIPRASTVSHALFEAAVRQARDAQVKVEVVEGRAPEVLAAADAAVVASGTATLEAALLGTPMVVVYRTSWLNALLVRSMVRLSFVSLVNILAEREVVRELLQELATPDGIARELSRLITPDVNLAMQRELRAISETLGTPGAPARVARAVLETIDGRGSR